VGSVNEAVPLTTAYPSYPTQLDHRSTIDVPCISRATSLPCPKHVEQLAGYLDTVPGRTQLFRFRFDF
jgi:hypothetical protein